MSRQAPGDMFKTQDVQLDTRTRRVMTSMASATGDGRALRYCRQGLFEALAAAHLTRLVNGKRLGTRPVPLHSGQRSAALLVSAAARAQCRRAEGPWLARTCSYSIDGVAKVDHQPAVFSWP